MSLFTAVDMLVLSHTHLESAQKDFTIQILNLNDDPIQRKTLIQNFVFIIVYFLTCLNLYFKAVRDAENAFKTACEKHDFPGAAALLTTKHIRIDAPRIRTCAPGADLPIEMSLLHDAIGRKDYPLVEFLLDHGARFDVKDELGDLPFGYAFDREDGIGTVKMVELLLSKGLPIDSVDQKGRTLLHFAYGMGYAHLAATLEEKGAKLDAGQNLLHFLYEIKDREPLILKLIQEKKLDPNDKNEEGVSLLEKAHDRGDFAFALELIDAGAEVDTPFQQTGKTFLQSIAGINFHMQEELLARGADPHQKDNLGRTALHHAASHGEIHYVVPLLEKAPELLDERDLLGRTALHCACTAPLSAPLVDFFLTRGADANGADQDGYTPLHIASLVGRADIVQALVDRKQGRANIDAQDRYGDTPLHLAAEHPETVEMLLRRGAQKLPNFQGKLPDVWDVERMMDLQQDMQDLKNTAQAAVNYVLGDLRSLASQDSQGILELSSGI